MWVACVRDEIQVVTFIGAESHSRLSTRAKSSSTVSERSGKGQDTVEKVCAREGEDRSRTHSFRERHDRVYGKEDR